MSDLGHPRPHPTDPARRGSIGVAIRDSEVAALDARGIASVASRLDGVVDYWVLGSQRSAPAVDPTVVTAIAARYTARLGYVVAASVHRDHPYNLARRLLSLDHATRGQLGWLATDSDPAIGFGTTGDSWTDHRLGPDHTSAAIGAVRALWRSWPLDSVVADRKRGIFVDTERVTAADVDDRYRIAGPLPLPGPRQSAIPVFGRGIGPTSDGNPDVVLSEIFVELRDHPVVHVNALDDLTLPDAADGQLLTVSLGALDDAVAAVRHHRKQQGDPPLAPTLRARLGLPTPPALDLDARRRIFPTAVPVAGRV
ncbi:LLM class flavin-dependent oxidoreductase [Gordonia sp. CPCC 206044]|uniref:luciferase n=1 Tax=Gordonia sp. CPCC 206044 TaxID=3140793 RepID=UPI003AF367AE